MKPILINVIEAMNSFTIARNELINDNKFRGMGGIRP